MDTLEKYKAALTHYTAKNFDEALELLEEVINSSPQWIKPIMLKATILHQQNKIVKLFLYLEKILPAFNFTLPEEKIFLPDVLNLLGISCQNLMMPESAVNFFRLASEVSETNVEACTKITNALFVANASENFSAEDFKKLYAEYKKHLSDIIPYTKKFYNHKRIRIGFLSGDFNSHPMVKWAWSLINSLDKNFFCVYCYSSVNKSDIITEYLAATVANWRDISKLADAQAAEIIRRDEIDILFDLSGHTSGNRLRVAAYRPATVQISGIGYMNSTGLDCFDYFLSDIYNAGNSEKYFTEKLIFLPHSHICFESTTTLQISSLPCLEKKFVTFGCFNQSDRLTNSILKAWAKILNAVPGSRLILKSKFLEKDDEKNFVSNRLKFFGIDIKRVEMRGFTKNYLREYDDVDIALDTFPYTGGVTTCEALYMGVPVLSLYGDRHGTRFGYSILKNIGLDELAVNSYEDYVERAIALANDWDLLSVLRKNLREIMRKSPLMDSKNYIREVEKAFIKILRDEQ